MYVKLISYTPNPEKVIAAAAKLCYSSSIIENIMDGLTRDKVAAFIEKLEKMGHQSPFEHASFTFGVEGVSRSFLAQITRHRLASYSVQSQRYVDKSKFEPVIPNIINNDPETKKYFCDVMNYERYAYVKLLNMILWKLIKKNYPETISLANFREKNKKEYNKYKKIAQENARSVLPNACDTKIIFTMNVRELYHFFNLRCCERAQDEIREVAYRMLDLCVKVSPVLFKYAGPPCVIGKCPEGDMSCGHPKTIKK